MIVTAGKTNVTAYFYIVGDSSHASPGEPVTGLLFSDIETGGSASYMRQGANRVDLTLVTQTVAGAHTDGGFIEVDATNMPGVYRCDYPDAAFATGVDEVILQVVVASANNAVAAPIKVQLFDIDVRDSVRGGMTSLPNANSEAPGGLYTRGSGAGQINQPANGQIDGNVVAMASGVITAASIAAAALNGKGDWNIGKTGYSISGAKTTLDALNDIAALDVWHVLESAVITASTMGLKVKTNLDDTISSRNATTPPTVAAIRTEMDSNSTRLSAIETDTQDLQTQIGAAGAGLTNLGGMSTAMKAEVNAEADTALADYDPPTNAEMEARTPTAAQLQYITDHAATAPPVTFTGGSTTTAVLGNVDGSAASSVDDFYNGRILIFNAGTLNEQATDITDYVGSTKTATITAVTTAVTSSHTAIMV